MWLLIRWFYIEWWKYLLKDCSGFKNFFCRIKGHSSVIWYNVSGLEPDMHCDNCGEDLG